jgi:hypothetical protein
MALRDPSSRSITTISREVGGSAGADHEDACWSNVIGDVVLNEWVFDGVADGPDVRVAEAVLSSGVVDVHALKS